MVASRSGQFTKNIWLYWHQGFERSPESIRRCVDQWYKLHPDWSIHLLDEHTVGEYIDCLPISDRKLGQLTLPHRSDLIRTKLLIKHGGVWADPTLFCVRKLDAWLPSYFGSGIFLFSRPGKDRVIANWLIASERENVILRKMLTALCEYWENNEFLNLNGAQVWYLPLLNRLLNRSPQFSRIWFTPFFMKVLRVYPYMVYHYKFFDLISSDAECRSIWEGTPKVLADLPHRLQKFGLLSPLTSEMKEFIDQKKCPVYKLTWKLGGSNIPDGTVLSYLFSQNR